MGRLKTFVMRRNPLLKGVGSGSPPSEEDGETEGLNELGSQADADGVERSLLNEDLRDVLRKMLANVRLME